MTVHPLNGASTGSVTKVLGPTQGTDYAGGMASPQVVEGPEGTKLLFTGWPTPNASDRSLFVSDFNNALQVSNVQKIVDATVLGSVEAAYGFYDPTSERWLIGAGVASGGRDVYLLEFDKDFSSYNAYNFGQSPKDCGSNAIGTQNNNLFLTWVSSSNNINVGKVSSDFPTVSKGGFSSSFNGKSILQNGTSYHRPDVHNAFYGVSGLTVLAEYFGSAKEQWTLHPSFVGWTDTSARSNIALTSTQPLIQMSLQGGGDNFGHPHFTTNLGRPLLFFAYFRAVTAGQNTHEIWAIEPEYNVLTAQDWFPLRGRITTSTPSDSFCTFGADSMTILVNTVNSGTLTVREGMSQQRLNNSEFVETTYSYSAGRNKFELKDPMHACEFRTNSGIAYIDVDLR